MRYIIEFFFTVKMYIFYQNCKKIINWKKLDSNALTIDLSPLI